MREHIPGVLVCFVFSTEREWLAGRTACNDIDIIEAIKVEIFDVAQENLVWQKVG